MEGDGTKEQQGSRKERKQTRWGEEGGGRRGGGGHRWIPVSSSQPPNKGRETATRDAAALI